MSQYVIFLLLGVSSGAVFAALALGLVVTYRSSGVINFATGSIALYTAYTYAYLRQGRLLSPIPGTSATYKVGAVLGFWPALLASLALAAALGLVLNLLIFRPLRTAPPVAPAVASIGVSVVITSTLTARLGTSGVAVTPILPTGQWHVLGVQVSQDRLYFGLIIIATAVGLTALYRFTRFGLATRAAAESEKGAYVSGIRPDTIASLNWMLSSAVAGLAGILIAPIVPLVPSSYALFIVPALAAAVLGRFQSLGRAVAGGLAIGMLQSLVTYLQSKYTWLPSSGLPELVLLALILLVLVVRARPLPSRGGLAVRSLGRAPRPQHLLVSAAAAAVLGLIALVTLTGSWREGLITGFIFGIIALSLVVVTGYAGQVSLAQLTLAGVAAFLITPLAHHHVPFPFGPLVAAVAAAVLGTLVGLPALRIRGLTVAVLTFGLAFAVEALWFRNSDLVPSGGIDIPTPKLFGLDLGRGSGNATARLSFGLLCLAALVGAAVGVALLRRSRLGAQMLALRANERSAAAAGINVVRVKLAAFAIGAFIAGVGGDLLAYKQTTVSYESFTALGGLALFATVYLAGITSVSGGVLAGVIGAGGIVFVAVDKVLSTGLWYSVISGVGLILTIILNPDGIVGPAHAVMGRSGRRSSQPASTAASRSERGLRVVHSEPVPPLLDVRDVSVRYGGLLAVNAVSMQVESGNIVGLIGPNGAGKTTLIDALSGSTAYEGTVHLAAQDLTGLRPYERARAGLGRTFQAIELYDDLSVRENVLVGLTASNGRREGASEALLDRTLRLLGLEQVSARPAGELSTGQRQLVSIARALVGRPAVLLLDEPGGGLDTGESAWLAERLRDIRDSGVTILMIDHDMSLVLGLCDKIYVLDFGTVIAEGSTGQIRRDRKVAAAYLGSTHAERVAT